MFAGRAHLRVLTFANRDLYGSPAPELLFFYRSRKALGQRADSSKLRGRSGQFLPRPPPAQEAASIGGADLFPTDPFYLSIRK